MASAALRGEKAPAEPAIISTTKDGCGNRRNPCYCPLNVLRFFLRLNKRMIYTMAETATLSSKFQISIPKAIRAAQHWEAGLTFAFIPKGTGVLLVPIPKRESLKGLAKGASPVEYRDRSDRV